jgi:hypothetical protein
MFDSLFQKYKSNRQYIQDLNVTLENLRNLRNPDWDNYDTNWFPAIQVSAEESYKIYGHLDELTEFGITESKNSSGTQIKVYKLKPQNNTLNLVEQFDIWLNTQDQQSKLSIIENITNSTVIKNSELHHSSVNKDIKEQNPAISPNIPTTFQSEQDNKPTKNWQIIGIVIAFVSLIFVILKHYNKI